MIRVVNKRAYKGEGVYIGRPSMLGNPYTVSLFNRGHCIELYREWLRWQWREDSEVKAELLRLVELSKKGDLVLICWCSPKACHGDVIKDALEKIASL